ncbi:MAG: hypothetical protein MZV64_42335 [Ignavibacteriales bacterium]|nr:hypothetical protein [Ignavibacteriales bacterium]
MRPTMRARNWRDAFVNVRPAAFAQIQGGKFKIPFGNERLTGSEKSRFRLPVARERCAHARALRRRDGARARVQAGAPATRPASSKTMATSLRELEPVEPLPGEEPAQRGPDNGLSAPPSRRCCSARCRNKYNNLEVGVAFTSAPSPRAGTTCRGTPSSAGSSSTGKYCHEGPADPLRRGAQLGDRPGVGRGWSTSSSRESREGQGAGNEDADRQRPARDRGSRVVHRGHVGGHRRESHRRRQPETPAPAGRLRRHRSGRPLRQTAVLERGVPAGAALEEPAGGEHRRQRRPHVDAWRELGM